MLVRLGTIEENSTELPQLSAADTERKDINHKRRTGDSKRREGVAWTLNPTTLSKLPEIQLGMEGEAVLDLVSATRLTRREVRHSRSVWDGLQEATKKANKANKDPAQPAIPRNAKEKRDVKRDKQFCKSDNEGTLWNLGTRRGLNQHDLAVVKAFDETGDHISWTRQQANIYRWMEGFERKHAEFHCIILYFKKMETTWETVAGDPESPTVAIKKINGDPEVHSLKFQEVCYPPFFDLATPLATRVEDFRNKQLEWMKELKIEQADLVYGATKAGTKRTKPVPLKGNSAKNTAKGKAKGKAKRA
ncbi:hypothetical protein PQX77_007911 [Marasmius sp. AFHP31]|nr:hypothetical protein PQX77_007911 [Marasmius sp. AFHP31]